MKYNIKLDELAIEVEVKPISNHIPDAKFSSITDEDLELLKKKELIVCEVHFKSTKNKETLYHFHPALAFSIDEEDMEFELQSLLEESDLLKTIIKHWEIIEGNEKPSWQED